MRKIIALTGLAMALAACATDRDQQQASLRCQQVGIDRGDADYEVCTQSYVSQQREKSLETNIHNAINAYPKDRRIPHTDVF